MEQNKEIGKLARAMFERQVSMKDLADGAGVTTMTISKLLRAGSENGIKNPKISTLKKIAKELNCEVSDIWDIK